VGRDTTAALAAPRPEEVLGGLAERITHRLRHELQAELAQQTADACRLAEKQVDVHHTRRVADAELRTMFWPVERALSMRRPVRWHLQWVRTHGGVRAVGRGADDVANRSHDLPSG
jgi:hypothetical protein